MSKQTVPTKGGERNTANSSPRFLLAERNTNVAWPLSRSDRWQGLWEASWAAMMPITIHREAEGQAEVFQNKNESGLIFVYLCTFWLHRKKKNTSLTKVTFICFLSSPRALHADLCQMLSKSYLYQRIPCAWKIFFPINSLLIVKAAVLSIINLSSLLPLLCVLQSIAFFDTG